MPPVIEEMYAGHDRSREKFGKRVRNRHDALGIAAAGRGRPYRLRAVLLANRESDACAAGAASGCCAYARRASAGPRLAVHSTGDRASASRSSARSGRPGASPCAAALTGAPARSGHDSIGDPGWSAAARSCPAARGASSRSRASARRPGAGSSSADHARARSDRVRYPAHRRGLQRPPRTRQRRRPRLGPKPIWRSKQPTRNPSSMKRPKANSQRSIPVLRRRP